MRPEDVPTCPDCDTAHLGRCGGIALKDRFASVRPSEEATPTRSRASYYDDDLVSHQFGGLTRKERREDLYDSTQGYGYAETQVDGSVVARDPKTKERRALSPQEVDRVYLSNGVQSDPGPS